MVECKMNIDGLTDFAKQKSISTIEKVDKAIQKLIETRGKINFNSVSIESGVSKAFLYKNRAIRERIEALRKQEEGLKSSSQVKREMTDASKDVIIAAKNKRIKELEEVVSRLKEELMHLREKIYDEV